MKYSHLFLILCATALILNCSENINNSISVIAHRGGANLAPENTLAAFSKSINLGVDMIEIDVRLSKDYNVIVIHDKTVDRTTEGTGKVKDLELTQLKKFDAGSWFNDEFLGERIPTLEEVFSLIDGRVNLLIEIKEGDETYPGLEKRVAELIDNYNAYDWVIVQSFNEKTVLRIKEFNPRIKTFFLLGRNFEEYINKIVNQVKEGNFQKKYDGLALHYSSLDSNNVEMLKELDFSIYTWTVNEKEKMINVIKLNINGIITDSPDILIELLNDR